MFADSSLVFQRLLFRLLLISPTIFPRLGFPILFFSRESQESHPCLLFPGEAKFGLNEIELADEYGLQGPDLPDRLSLIEEHEDEIRAAATPLEVDHEISKHGIWLCFTKGTLSFFEDFPWSRMRPFGFKM